MGLIDMISVSARGKRMAMRFSSHHCSGSEARAITDLRTSWLTSIVPRYINMSLQTRIPYNLRWVHMMLECYGIKPEKLNNVRLLFSVLKRVASASGLRIVAKGKKDFPGGGASF